MTTRFLFFLVKSSVKRRKPLLNLRSPRPVVKKEKELREKSQLSKKDNKKVRQVLSNRERSQRRRLKKKRKNQPKSLRTA